MKLKNIKKLLEEHFGPIDVSLTTLRERLMAEGARYKTAKKYEPSINLPCRKNSRFKTIELMIQKYLKENYFVINIDEFGCAETLF